MQNCVLVKRLAPLFVAKFLLNFVFWYSVEKIFMTTIGFDSATIGLMVAIYSIMSVSMEIPSGILADRWSRKGVMILSAICLLISGLIGGISHTIPIFLISSIFWGFFDAFSSGTADSMVYDTLLEEQGNADNYEKIFGWYSSLGGIALVISALLGGLIGDQIGLRQAFLWSIPPAVLAIFSLMIFRDTTIQKESEETKILEHTKRTFAAVFKNSNLLFILISLFSVSLINGIIGEMYQVWYLALDAPIAVYGLAGALVLSTYGAGGAITGFFTKRKRTFIAMLIILVSVLVLIFSRNIWIVIGSQFLIGFLSFTLILTLTAQMHRFLPSKYRAGAGSATNTLGRIIFIPLVLGFGWLSQNQTVFMAGWILFVLVLVGMISEINARNRDLRSI